MNKMGKCAACRVKDKICKTKNGKKPSFCSTELYQKAIKKAQKEYEKPEIKEFAQKASIQEAQCYANREKQNTYLHPTKPRLQEIIEFANKMGYHKLGLAFCSGLSNEAFKLSNILEKYGFDVVSVICKVGGIKKEQIGIQDKDKVRIGEYETMCNPIAQAEVLNSAGTDLNIMLGLCVGHDSLFIKYSNAPVTVFAVKDRVLGHNPLAAIYTLESYYQRFLKGFKEE